MFDCDGVSGVSTGASPRASSDEEAQSRRDCGAAGESEQLKDVPTFRDFVVLYIAEGYKRCRNTASVCNSDPGIVALAAHWLRRLSGRTPKVSVQYHADQEPDALRSFWGETLGVEPADVQLHVKSNSGQLRTRVWRCKYGMAAVDVHATYLRARPHPRELEVDSAA